MVNNQKQSGKIKAFAKISNGESYIEVSISRNQKKY